MEHESARLILEAAVPPLPVSSVDVERAVRRGRTIRRRRAAAVSSAAIAVAALATAPLAIAATRPPAVPLAASPVARFDPLVRTVRIGWLPSGLGPAQWETTPTQQQFGARDPEGGQDGGLVLDVRASGLPLDGGALGLPDDHVEHPTAPVKGHRALCLVPSDAPGSCPALRWEYRPGAWARVSYAGREGRTPATAAAVARRVAESVDLLGNERVRMPFRFTGRTGQLQVLRTLVTAPPGSASERWSANISVSNDPSDDVEGNWGMVHGVEVGVDSLAPAGGAGDDHTQSNTTVQGKPAHRDEQSLVIWGIKNTRLFVSVHDGKRKPLDVVGELTLVANPADYTQWLPLN